MPVSKNPGSEHDSYAASISWTSPPHCFSAHVLCEFVHSKFSFWPAFRAGHFFVALIRSMARRARSKRSLQTLFGGYYRRRSTSPAACGGWRLHDLRRTTASGLQRCGVVLEVTEKVLDHISGSLDGIVSVYQQYEYEKEKRAAAQEAWAGLLATILSTETTKAKVVAVRRGKAAR